ncbi:hypothetical protein ACI2I2_16225 [Scandinavium sp. NPDC088450]|uniref:hypothetical protein n=1 Tax=Scandinavium sp. NPDC088450 TaxID=3364514 RepID=UPI00384F4E65
MYSVGDLVQPKLGGPKMKIIELRGDEIVTVAASDEEGKKYTLKATEVSHYHEDDDFGVC